MNPSSLLLVFSLLLLSLLHSKSQDEGLSTNTQNSGGCDDEEANISSPEHNYYISTAGKKAKNRKLLVFPSIPSSHHTTSEKTKKMIENNENAKGDRKGEETKVNWVFTPLKKQHDEQEDMAEMDYTAARRKPPIHN